MKYILKNCASFIKKDRSVFAVYILCTFLSAIVVLSFYGIYQEFELRKVRELEMSDTVWFNFENDSQVCPELSDVLKYCESLPDSIQERYRYYVCVVLPNEDGVELDPDEARFDVEEWTCYTVKDGRYGASASFEEIWKEQGTLARADRLFTDEEVADGEYVCVAPADEFLSPLISRISEDEYIINGKQYKSIATLPKHEAMLSVPMVPVTTLDETLPVRSLAVCWDGQAVPYVDYGKICGCAEQTFGDSYIEPISGVPEKDVQHFYSVMAVLCVLSALLAAVTLATLFEYIMIKRTAQRAVFRMCGMSYVKVVAGYAVEGLIFQSVTFLFGAMVFHFGILPLLSRVYEYIYLYYNMASYGVIGSLYLLVVMLVNTVMIVFHLHRSVGKEMRGAVFHD